MVSIYDERYQRLYTALDKHEYDTVKETLADNEESFVNYMDSYIDHLTVFPAQAGVIPASGTISPFCIPHTCGDESRANLVKECGLLGRQTSQDYNVKVCIH